MKYSIGIDIGKNGGIVIIDEKNNVVTMSMPKIGNEIDVNRIVKIFSSIDGDVHCGVEDVHSIFGVGAAANFQFGRALGIIEAAVISAGFPFTKIAPKVWQKEMWQGIKPIEINTGKKTKTGNIKFKTDTKATSLLAATRLYPSLDLRATERSKKAHDGIVDALLIGTFVKRKFQ